MNTVFRILILLLLSLSSAFAQVCVVKSYSFDAMNKVALLIISDLSRDVRLMSPEEIKFGIKCRNFVLLGSPAVLKVKDIYSRRKLYVYSFVLFPEELGLEKYENFIGIRIFPLPTRTVDKFSELANRKVKKVALIVGEKTKDVAARYVKGDKRFKIVVVKNDIGEILDKLQNYKYIYLFPDPVVMKVSNILKLLDFASLRGAITISNIPETAKFGVNFIYAVDYEKLACKIVDVLKGKIKEDDNLIPCPAKVYVWKASEELF